MGLGGYREGGGGVRWVEGEGGGGVGWVNSQYLTSMLGQSRCTSMCVVIIKGSSSVIF